MKAAEKRSVMIPGIYMRAASINPNGKVLIIKSDKYQKFYITCQNEENDRWSVNAIMEYGYLYIPKELYSAKAKYKFGVEGKRLYMLRTA